MLHIIFVWTLLGQDFSVAEEIPTFTWHSSEHNHNSIAANHMYSEGFFLLFLCVFIKISEWSH